MITAKKTSVIKAVIPEEKIVEVFKNAIITNNPDIKPENLTIKVVTDHDATKVLEVKIESETNINILF